MLILTIEELNNHIQAVLKSDELLSDVWVEGEISNLKRASSGHLYLTLKDDTTAIDAVMWRNNVNRLSSIPQHGDAVFAHGAVSLYTNTGRLQLYLDTIQPAGLGLLHARFEELRTRLEAEGLFDIARKRPLPTMPRSIGVATSAQGAAWHDIRHVLARRYPLADVYLAPCVVQGEHAPASIVQALATLYHHRPDVIVLARGGGALEDLACFNDERVARAVFASPVPIVTGVGHETDTTIVDYIADHRAPTPSAAAEVITPDQHALRAALTTARATLRDLMQNQTDDARVNLDHAAQRMQRHHPTQQIAVARQSTDDQQRRATNAMRHLSKRQRLELARFATQLATLNPYATLARGYALVEHGDHLLTDAATAPPGTSLRIRLHRGTLSVTVDAVDLEAATGTHGTTGSPAGTDEATSQKEQTTSE